MKPVTRVLLVLVLAAIALLGSATARAQGDDAAIMLPLAPDPARCTGPTYPLADLRALWEEVNAGGNATPSAATTDLTGTPADEATVTEATQLIIDVLACSANGNAGLHDATFLTERHLRDNLTGLTEEEFTGFYTETPVSNPPENWIMLYAVRDVMNLADGRVVVTPDVIVPGVGRFQDHLVLARVDGKLKIDESISSDTNLYPGE